MPLAPYSYSTSLQQRPSCLNSNLVSVFTHHTRQLHEKTVHPRLRAKSVCCCCYLKPALFFEAADLRDKYEICLSSNLKENMKYIYQSVNSKLFWMYCFWWKTPTVIETPDKVNWVLRWNVNVYNVKYSWQKQQSALNFTTFDREIFKTHRF